jgi:hypothetical protein
LPPSRRKSRSSPFQTMRLEQTEVKLADWIEYLDLRY